MKNKKLIIEKVQKLILYYENGEIPILSNHEVHPDLPLDDRLNYIYFTFPPSLNFQRSSPAMWKAAFETFNDPVTNYLFYPEKVVNEKREKIQCDLIKHKLGLQKNKHTDIWIKLSQTFHNKYKDDPRELLKSLNFDVAKIIYLLQKESKKDFPYLSGIKMSNYWLYILSKFTDAKFENINEISIIPDTHVIQSTKVLGLSKELPTSLDSEKLWKELLIDTEITTVQMHPILWNWSRNNFLPEV